MTARELAEIMGVTPLPTWKNVRCPCHDDRDGQSLGIKQDNRAPGGVAIKCWASCGYGQKLVNKIEAELKRRADVGEPSFNALNAGPKQEPKRELVPGRVLAEYIYKDANGRVVKK